MNKVFFGDCRESMRQMISDGVKVQMCVTSPPYYFLRDYRHPDQLGLEETPEQYIAKLVEVFRMVRDLLADDGVLWLNIGDSYAGSGRGAGGTYELSAKQNSNRGSHHEKDNGEKVKYTTPGCKPKDLIGIPWLLAKALRDPYYTGKIKNESDRVWLAAIIDGEGCFFIHKRKAGSSAYSKFTKADGSESNYERTMDTYGVGLEICNTNKAIIDRVAEIVGGGTFTEQSPQQNNRRKQTIYRWRIAPNEAKRIAQEVYPHLVGKQHQARLLFNCPSSGDAAAEAHQAMMDLHNGVATSVDYPSPPTLFEKGWYLRQDVIWSKKNPMPESVTDRCTKSHEYIFLLSKSQKYYFDADAIAEPVTASTIERLSQPTLDTQEGSSRVPGKTNGNMKAVGVRPNGIARNRLLGYDSKENAMRGKDNLNPDGIKESELELAPLTRNKRSVWTVNTKPYSGAHFAVFPEELIEPCILAGSRVGDVVLDPFFGSGTTGQVAQNLGRQWIGCELNQGYEQLQKDRLAQGSLVL
jgi:DNA modification methylase